MGMTLNSYVVEHEILTSRTTSGMIKYITPIYMSINIVTNILVCRLQTLREEWVMEFFINRKNMDK